MCDQRERLMDYLYDEAAPAERRVVEAHIEGCADCRDEMRAFRRVREDLLAWDVPETTAIWTPFASSAQTPWYRQVPAWAMAAAAGVMFVLGTAGGFLAQTLVASRPAMVADGTMGTTVNPAVPPPPVTPAPVARDGAIVPVALGGDEILTLVRAELNRLERQRATTRGTETEALVAATAEKQWAKVYHWLQVVAEERELERRGYDQRISSLQTQLNDLMAGFKSMNNSALQNQTKGIQ